MKAKQLVESFKKATRSAKKASIAIEGMEQTLTKLKAIGTMGIEHEREKLHFINETPTPLIYCEALGFYLDIASPYGRENARRAIWLYLAKHFPKETLDVGGVIELESMIKEELLPAELRNICDSMRIADRLVRPLPKTRLEGEVNGMKFGFWVNQPVDIHRFRFNRGAVDGYFLRKGDNVKVDGRIAQVVGLDMSPTGMRDDEIVIRWI